MSIHERDQNLKDVPYQLGVAVQQAGITSPRHLQPQIVVLGVQQRYLVAHQGDIGKGRLHHLRASIRRPIVDADYLESNALGVIVNRL